jgi:gliding motility-associated-like protein
LQLSAVVSTGASVHWSPATYLSSTTIPNPTSAPIQPITYIVEAVSQAGCSKKDTIAVQVIEPPTVVVMSDTAVCEGQPILLNTTANNYTSFQWQPAIDLIDPTKLSPIALPKNPTIFTITAVNSACRINKSVSVDIKSLPVVSLTDDTTICASKQVQLNVSGGISYQWTPSAFLSSDKISNPVAAPIADVVYKVEVKGSNNCVRIDSLAIAVRSKPSFSVQPLGATICKGDTLRLVASGGDSYQWKPTTQVLSPNSGSTLIVPDATTFYQVNIEDNICHIKDSLVTVVNVVPDPVLLIQKSNDIDCFVADAHLTVTGASRYTWNSASSLSNSNIPNPIVTPHQTTTYYVKGFSTEGCSSSDSIEVKVISSERSSFLLPSAFTPNYDGLNDCFGVKYWGTVTEFSMKIFDRWGKLVFSTINPRDCWDGRYKSIDQPIGIYVYLISAQTLCGNVSKRGTLSLLR